MKSRGRSAGLPAAAAIVSMLLIVGWLLAREPSPLQRCSLPDGSVLTLEAVTYGRQHRFVGGPWWRRLLTPLLPAPLKGIIAGTPPAEYHSDSETIVFWVSRSGQVRAPAGLARAVIFDEKGHELDIGVPTSPAWPGGEVRSFISAVFPRRTKRVGLRFYHSAGQGAPAAVGEFLVANPAHGPFPVWNVEPLPTVRRDGDLSITLSALTTGLRDRGPVRAPWSRGQGIWTCATTRIRRSGQSAKGWQLCWVSLHDATGNRLDPIGLDSTSANGAVNGTFLGSLWPDEVAWKVRVQYAPTAQFSPSDLWSVQGIPLAASGVTINSGATATRHGITLRLIGTTGPHTPRTDGGFSYVPQGDSPSVQVEAVSPPDALQVGKGVQLVLVRATDERGRPVAGRPSTISSTGEHSFELKTAANARLLNLTFAVVKNRVAEFVVRPAWGWKGGS